MRSGLAIALIFSTAWWPAPAASGQHAPTGARVRETVRRYRAAHELEILRELTGLLVLPNVAADREAIRRNAAALIAMLERRGVSARLLEAAAAPPAVYGELRAPGATRTVVLYAHYDGQPADPAQWAGDPWAPVLRTAPLEDGGRVVPWDSVRAPVDPEWRLYARSASDDKSPIVAALTALDALRDAGITPSLNLKFFLEGEEEAGSDHLRPLLERHAELLEADLWIFLDGPVHQTRRWQVVFGARGVMGLGLTVYGANRTLHSGHYGNWAPNPAVMLVHLLATMRDTDGRILIPGFQDDVRTLSPAEREALAALPDVETDLRRSLLLGRTEGGGARLLDQTMQPGLNLDGLHAGDVGAAARNAIPTEATAAIDFRLVPDQTPERVRELVEGHIRQQGYHVVTDEPDAATRQTHPNVVRVAWGGGYRAIRTAMDLPASRAVLRVAGDAAAEPVVAMPMLGGSLPLHHFAEVFGVPLIIVPMVNHDNNQHAANENLRIRNLWDGIELYAALIARLGAEWR